MSIDTKYFENLTEKINNINACEDLQKAVDEAFVGILAQFSDIEEQLAHISPLIALITLSIVDLPSVITAVKTLITGLVGPQVAAFYAYTAQVTALIAAVNNLQTAITDAADRIGSCSIDIPLIP